MRLTPNFDLTEFTVSETASRKGIDNTPTSQIISNLAFVADALESVRRLLNAPVLITSGYRSPALNEEVGGVSDSAHVQGWAADFIAPAFGAPIDICRAVANSQIKFDQLIQEHAWVHLSVAPTMRQEVLTKAPSGNGYVEGL